MFPIINFNAVEFLWHDKWATADSRVRAGIIVLRYIYAIVRDFFSGYQTRFRNQFEEIVFVGVHNKVLVFMISKG